MLRQKPIWSPYRNNWGTASPVLHKAPLLLIIQILQEAIYLVCNKSFCFLFAFSCFSNQLESISFPRGETQCKLGNMYRHVPMSKDTCGKLCEMENKQTLSLTWSCQPYFCGWIHSWWTESCLSLTIFSSFIDIAAYLVHYAEVQIQDA